MSFRQKMSWLHTWAGLVVGWLLFAIFLTGTACYFRPEISAWMHRLAPITLPDQPTQARLAAAWLQAEAPDAVSWLIDFSDGREPVLKAAAGRPHGYVAQRLDPVTGAPEAGPETVGGDFLFYVHFTLIMSDWGRILGRYLVGICAMIMGVAIVTGVIVHKRIFKDAFTFRPRAAAQRAWLDGHNLLGVMSLPFHLMITWSGLITLMLLYMPWAVDAGYPGGRAGYAADLDGIAAAGAPAGPVQPAALTDLGQVVAAASAAWSADGREIRVGRVEVDRPGTTAARLTLTPQDADQLARLPEALVFDGTTGRLIADGRGQGGAVAAVHHTLYGLHLARFAGLPLRWLFFAAGLAGTAMIATGLVLWSVKRRPKTGAAGRGRGHRLVDALNIGCLVGLPAAIAGQFLANRLLPADIAGRAVLEPAAFYLVWLAFLLAGAWRSDGPGWMRALVAAALLWAVVPVADVLVTGRDPLGALAAGDRVFWGLQLACLIMALALGRLAMILRARSRRGGAA